VVFGFATMPDLVKKAKEVTKGTGIGVMGQKEQ